MNKNNVTIGMGQLLVEGGEPDRNLQRACEMAKEASRKGCDILLLPECLDLTWTHPSARMEAQPIPGPFSDKLCQFAKDYNIYICGGLTEKCNDKVYNAAILINNYGEIILKYRKINVLVCAQEFYSIGNSLSVVNTPFGIIGVNICSDNYIDSLEIGHTLARMGAQLILSPSSWTVDYSLTETEDPYGEKWLKPYSILSGLYDLVIISVTSVGYIVGGPYEGKKMVGCSMAVDKNGVIVKGVYNELTGNLVIAEINVVPRDAKGTDIGKMLNRKGYYSHEI
jgi:predicted amidohydrolase